MCRRAERGQARFADRSGFTLIEAMVAFAVMATVLGVLYRAVVQTRSGAIVFAAHTQEEVVTRSLLAEFRARRDLRDGSYAGTRDGRRWTLRASAMDLAAQLPKNERALGPGRPQTGPLAAAGNNPGGPVPETGRSEPPEPVWVAQRLVLQVATGARPLQTEVVHLVRQAAAPDGDAR